MSKRLSDSEAFSPHPKRQLLSSDNFADHEREKNLFTIAYDVFNLGEEIGNEKAAIIISWIMEKSGDFRCKFQGLGELEKVVSAHPELIISLRSAWEARRLQPLLDSPLLNFVDNAVAPEGLNVVRPRGNKEEQEWATQKSWEYRYKGNAAIGLWAHIKVNYNRKSAPQVYANYASIVQSSGMGKSRMTDELAKTCFVITMNLRGMHTTGYPPADGALRDYLTSVSSKNEAFDRADKFFEALFTHTLETLKQEEYEGCDYSNVASKFRKRMTEGQTMQSHNQYHKQFYQEVIYKASQLKRDPPQDEIPPQHLDTHEDTYVAVCIATDISSQSASAEPAEMARTHSQPTPAKLALTAEPAEMARTNSQPTPAKLALTLLCDFLKKLYIRPDGENADEVPLIILAFDEAHTIAERKGSENEEQWSVIYQVRQLLRSFRTLSVFSLFLSTTGKISEFTPAAEYDLSKRIIKGDLIPGQPLTDLGFDPFAHKISLNGDWNLECLTSPGHICSMGRPLFATRWQAGSDDVKRDILIFAAAKLMAEEFVKKFSDDQKLACLAQRIPLEFQSTNYIEQSNERKQVEGHMRVCLKIDGACQTMTTASSSEPILSEAAYFLMTRDHSFNAADALKSVMEGFAISKGDRGEFLVLLLLTLARDATVGPPSIYGNPEKGNRFFSLADFFLGGLFNCSEKSAQELHKLASDFPQAKMHFSHFVKVHEFKAIDLTSLLLLIGRGAGVLCANNQNGVDIINAFLKNGTKLEIGNAGLVLIQVKNDSAYGTQPQQELFDAMNPHDLNILEDKGCAVPIIKIVFALAAKKPLLKVVRKNASASYRAVIYEIWCAGLSPDVLLPIKEKGVWEALLQASYGWKSLYETPLDIAKKLRQSATPGAARENGHYSCWATREC
ncbi:uncharacterized protein LACBIDRAFT_295447 [Laccaria bicolor S238N-H82]|uniref:Predicted protein n=1 Tax=Laccaria bicolor (strain S238N-H82 / ATCC MYA-4686) TaxID=486041 RepID=B0DSN8_LACBS|nr:uncharacterized protein LACBIDRAFT_295447 [Laccaria bicolor S238N-H82]EDR02266.1 predicted protein [Laccaria bicolor S238N-H82]|eukprot:XP_001886943.1 predicted protein [Laccaria bicolor S238N-H82]